MAYDGLERRLKVFNLLEAALVAKLYFKEVYLQMPVSPPTAKDIPSAYITLTGATSEGFTEKEKDEEMRVAVILFVRSDKNVDRVKIEALSRAEEALMDLQTDADFTAVASMIDMDNYDAGPIALASYGFDFQVLPPLGVVRLEMRITLAYMAFN